MKTFLVVMACVGAYLLGLAIDACCVMAGLADRAAERRGRRK